MNTWIRSLRAALLLSTALSLAACGGGGGSGSQEPLSTGPDPLGVAVAQTVGSAGGNVEASTLGVKLRLSIPAGALPTDTTVRITPVQPSAGDSVSVRLEPSGTVFAKPVTIVVEFPDGQAPGTRAALRQRLGGADVFVATTANAEARTLTARLSTFGGTTVQTLAARAERRNAFRAGALDDPLAEDYGTLSAQQVASVGDSVLLARLHIDALRQSGRYADALAAQLGIADLLQRSGEDGYTAQALPFLVEAGTTACEGLNAAIDASRQAPLAAPGDFKPIVAKLMYWDALVQRLGTNACSSPAAQAAAQDVIARELVLARNNFAAATTPVLIQTQAADIREARGLAAEAATLTDSLATPMVMMAPYSNHLRDDLINPALVPARKAAWSQAVAGQALSAYVPLIDAFGATSVLQQDVQYLRTAIVASTRDAGGQVRASTRLGIHAPPAEPIDPVRSTRLSARGASIEIGGNVATLACPNSDNEVLTVTFDGHEVARLSSAGDMALSASLALPALNAAALLQAANLPADDAGTHTLVIARTGAACAATFGISDEVLATVTLDYAATVLSATFRGVETSGFWCNSGSLPALVNVTITRPSANSTTAVVDLDGTVLSYRRGFFHMDFPQIVGDLATNATISGTNPGGEETVSLIISGNKVTGTYASGPFLCGDPEVPSPGIGFTINADRE